MAKQTIGIGSTANDGSGDTLRDAFDKTNDNFTELYLAADPSDIAGDNYIVNPVDNSIDTANGITRSVICGGGGSGTGNHIGQTAKPTLTHPSPPAEWADDSAYPADGNAGSVATIAGGYDNVCNQIAGTIAGGGHNYVKYNVDGHAVIVGGSFNVMVGARGYIGGGRYNVVTANFGVINGGDTNRVSGANGFIGSGSANTASAGGSAVIAALSSTASGLYSLVQGNAVTVSGDYSVGFGQTVTVSGDYSMAVGGVHSVTHDYCLVAGRDVKTIAGQAIYLGGDNITQAGDVQTLTQVVGGRTTNATLTTLAGGLTLDTTKVTTAIGKITLIGVEVGTTNTVTLSLDFAIILNGATSATIIKLSDGTLAGPSSGPTLAMVTHRDDITVGTCHVRMTLGAVLIRVTGNAAKTINWAGRLDITNTLHG